MNKLPVEERITRLIEVGLTKNTRLGMSNANKIRYFNSLLLNPALRTLGTSSMDNIITTLETDATNPKAPLIEFIRMVLRNAKNIDPKRQFMKDQTVERIIQILTEGLLYKSKLISKLSSSSNNFDKQLIKELETLPNPEAAAVAAAKPEAAAVVAAKPEAASIKLLNEREIETLYDNYASEYRDTLKPAYAEGGFGKVYKAGDKAIKVIELSKYPYEEREFIIQDTEKEAAVLKHFNDIYPPIFPKYYGHMKIGMNMVIVMEFLNGIDLYDYDTVSDILFHNIESKNEKFKKRYEDNKKLYDDIVKNNDLHKILTDVKALLKRLHSAGYVHRDIKEHNTMIVKTSTGDYQVYLIDPGLAVTEGTNIKDENHGTYSPYYIEQVEGNPTHESYRWYSSLFDDARKFRTTNEASKNFAIPALNSFAFNSMLKALGVDDPSLKMTGGSSRSKKRRTHRKAKLTRRRRRRTHRR